MQKHPHSLLPHKDENVSTVLLLLNLTGKACRL